MTSSLVARLALVAAGSSLLLVGVADAARGQEWALPEVAGAGALLLGVALEASGIVRIGRRPAR
ncbi:hypothetical protein [Microbacterium sp. B19]|uniref:hypothetical protein n=1 Tax=Microbacterium sp. B19 TaxID=96765 RepID=UPI0003499696|nr:hypothetical protein [Microbacterium sp. B19]